VKPLAEMIPTVRVTLESMRAQLVHAFADYDGAIAKAVAQRVNEAVTEETVSALIDRELQNILDKVVREHIEARVRNVVYATERNLDVAKIAQQRVLQTIHDEAAHQIVNRMSSPQ
jgi:urease accessory protein UreF